MLRINDHDSNVKRECYAKDYHKKDRGNLQHRMILNTVWSYKLRADGGGHVGVFRLKVNGGGEIAQCQAGRPGSHPALSACFRKVEFYQGAIDLFPPVLTSGSPKAVHVLSCL